MTIQKYLRLNTLAEFTALQKRIKTPPGKQIALVESGYDQQAKPNKHHAIMSEADCINFPSKKHKAHYLLLKAMQHNGEIRFFQREVPFDLVGHYDNGRIVRHFVDFAICQLDGTFKYQEVKGRDLPMGKWKRLLTQELYGIKIEVIF